MDFVVGKNKVLEIMRNKGYLRKKKTNWRKNSSYEGDKGGTKPNHMNRDFKTSMPYEKCGTDITIFPLKKGAVYLSPIIDFNSREVLSYIVGKDVKMDKI